MVRIKISDLQPDVGEQLFKEISNREMKKIEGGIFSRRPRNTVETNEASSTTNTQATLSSTLSQVNGLLDNLRFELDKIFGRL